MGNKKILIINCGSSSIKYKVYCGKGNVLTFGLIERLNGGNSWNIKHNYLESNGEFKRVNYEFEGRGTHIKGMEEVVKLLKSEVVGCIKDIDEINYIGHRVVHGGELSGITLIDDEVKKIIKEYSKFAPLHNPANLIGIKSCEAIFYGTKQYVLFDTSFHQTMKEENFLYAIPLSLYKKEGIRRYGFHGMSHEYSYKKYLSLEENKKRVIICHLGNGASITAVNNGEVIMTSCGMTPVEGLIMGTRSGDIDAGIVLELLKNHSIEDVDNILNKESGIKGILGDSSDFREIQEQRKIEKEKNIEDGNGNLIYKMYMNRIIHYIGGYIARMGGVDGIIFTGGIGENVIELRKDIISHFGYCGIELDDKRNENIINEAEKISNDGSSVDVYVISADEEKIIFDNIIENVS